MSLLGGAIADRFDRRMLLLLVQISLIAAPAGLAAITFAGDPPLWGLYVLGAALAGFNAVQNVVRSAMIPNLVEPRLRAAPSRSNFGPVLELTLVVGPGVGGVLIAWLGVGATYVIDAASCLAMVAAVIALRRSCRSEPRGLKELGIWKSSARDCGSSAATRRSWGPRSAIPPRRDDVRHAPRALPGAVRRGLRRRGGRHRARSTPPCRPGPRSRRSRPAGSRTPGAWDGSRSSRCWRGAPRSRWRVWCRRCGPRRRCSRSRGRPTASARSGGSLDDQPDGDPDHMRGRMSSVFSLVVTSGPRLGDVEAGAVASATTPRSP